MTTVELKVKSGVGKNIISKIIKSHDVRPALIGKLAKALNIDVEQIVDIK